MPTGSADVVRVALPELRVPVPSDVLVPHVLVVQLEKVTDPVGTPEADDTVAVKVTGWPALEGFGEDVRAVEVPSSSKRPPGSASTTSNR